MKRNFTQALSALSMRRLSLRKGSHLEYCLWLLLLLSSLLLFFSCGVSHNYHIEGTVRDSSLNGKYIFLQEVAHNQLSNIDSALVQNGRFAFNGREDSTVIRTLNFYPTDSQITPLVFVLQGGDFQAVLDTLSYMTGSEQNDKLHTYFAELRYYQNRIASLLKDYRLLSDSDQLTDSLNLAFQGWYDSYREEMRQLSYDFSLLNNNSVAGALVFLQAYTQFSTNQVNTILDDAGPEFLGVPGIEEVERQERIERLVAVGNNYIDFALPDSLNQNISVSSLLENGKHWVLIDFWASWCRPCIQKIGVLKELYEQYHHQGLDILGVSLDNNRMDWLNGLKLVQAPWPQVSDLKGWDCEAVQLYGVQAIPYYILIDPQGKIVVKGIRGTVLQQELKKIFQ